MKIIKKYLTICTSCGGNGFIKNPQNPISTTAITTVPCPVCNGSKVMTATEYLDRPDESLSGGEENVYEIDFNGHLKTKIIVSNNTIKVDAAMNGWGDGVSLNDIKISKV